MNAVKINGYDYIKIDLKCGGFLYVEPFDDGEEEEKRKIYDEYMGYLSYIDVAWEEDFARLHYDAVVKELSECEDFLNYIDIWFSEYVWAHSLGELLEIITKSIYSPEELLNGLGEMYNDRVEQGEETFCANYLINKVGDIYVYGE